MSQYLLSFTGVDASAGPEAVPVFPSGGKVGDVLLSATVIAQGSGSEPVGTDVTGIFMRSSGLFIVAANTYQPIPSAKNISLNGVAGSGFSAPQLTFIQQSGINLLGATILALMQTS